MFGVVQSLWRGKNIVPRSLGDSNFSLFNSLQIVNLSPAGFNIAISSSFADSFFAIAPQPRRYRSYFQRFLFPADEIKRISNLSGPLDIIRSAGNVREEGKKKVHSWPANCTPFARNTSCVLSLRHRQRVPFPRSANFFRPPFMTDALRNTGTSLFRVLAKSFRDKRHAQRPFRCRHTTLGTQLAVSLNRKCCKFAFIFERKFSNREGQVPESLRSIEAYRLPSKSGNCLR